MNADCCGTRVICTHFYHLLFLTSIDPYGYATKSLAMNEFLAPRYGQRPYPGSDTIGELYLEAFGLPTDPAWRWGGVVFIVGYACILVGISVAAFVFIRFDRNIGSARAVDEEPVPVKAGSAPASPDDMIVPARAPRNAATEMTPLFALPARGKAIVAAQGATSPLLAILVDMPSCHASAARLLPFEAASVAFRDISYTVKLSRLARVAAGGVSSRQLLQGISGYAVPGRMLALMGASGAGEFSGAVDRCHERFPTPFERREDNAPRCLGWPQEQRHDDG